MSEEREALMDLLVEGWRRAENHYLETEDDCWKWFMLDLEKVLEVTDSECKWIRECCQGMGV